MEPKTELKNENCKQTKEECNGNESNVDFELDCKDFSEEEKVIGFCCYVHDGAINLRLKGDPKKAEGDAAAPAADANAAGGNGTAPAASGDAATTPAASGDAATTPAASGDAAPAAGTTWNYGYNFNHGVLYF